MRRIRMPLLTVALTGCFGIFNSAQASVTGVLASANCAGGGVTVSGAAITWTPNGTVAGTGCIVTGAGTTLSSTVSGAVGNNVNANIKNLTLGPPVQIDHFIDVLGTPIDFILAAGGLVLPSAPTDGTTCAGLLSGHSCIVAAGSPFLLTAVAGGQTSISLAAFGTVIDGAGPTNGWNGTFTTQAAQDAGTIQSTILGGGSVSTTHSEVLIVSPEPAAWSMGLMGVGLLLGLRFKRRKA